MKTLRALLVLLASASRYSCGGATVTTTAYSTNALGNGVQTVFNFSFPGVASTYVYALLTDSSGNQTVPDAGLGPDAIHGLAQSAAAAGATLGYGGILTLSPISGRLVSGGSTLTIYRSLPLTQTVSLANQASYGQFSRLRKQWATC
jgi:hypothetical protein